MKPLVQSTIALAACTAFSSAETVYTGDTLSGYPVISALDITDVPSNTISRFWLSPGAGQGGLAYFLPIFVARGNEESLEIGRKLSLSASIHGDELNPVAVVQKVFAQLNESVTSGDFNGTIIGLPTQNPQGNFLNQRNFFTSSSNGFFTDLNRNFPGRNISSGGSLVQSYTDAIWNNVWGNSSNVDVAVDFHPLSTGSNGPLWAYADYGFEGVQRIAELAQPDMIKIDPGEPGSIETTWVQNGIPAITLEIGPANIWNQTLIQRAVDFTFRLLNDLQITSGEEYQPDLSNIYVATNFSNPRVLYSGWVELDIDVLEDVEEGQVIGRVYNSWGDKVEDLMSQVTGRVLTVLVDPAVEIGASVASIGYNATSGA
ncbi:uncharacterized protein CLAFUR5_07255 [Fulvia fulva]|uniref:Succinylglutamate desuccinylase/Aspartoacylase catalytic domain-containing protein n=1 Tax=Passalora fulva TaxID=5499 RepID=A0A9Q8PA03_PASFU|nr:uncharacterized protein CLAFUR5_07255 [Fulvia fulva]UJO18615.1 hypothetical protein CLAFUR5_07255 [Fulvia fulva]WPV31571.1 hypothetical protein CLAFUW7_07122 [Fulvia fulva]